MEMTPWNASGSEWDVRELWGWDKKYDDSLRIGHRGDYDFTQSVLITILYEFGDQLEYDTDAPRRLWVMKSATGNKLDRDYTSWPRLSVVE